MRSEILACCLLPVALATAQPGITAAPVIARAYDLILDANFDELKKTLPATCPPAPMVACKGLEALSLCSKLICNSSSSKCIFHIVFSNGI